MENTKNISVVEYIYQQKIANCIKNNHEGDIAIKVQSIIDEKEEVINKIINE